jgi:hypothetical protein
MSKGWFLGEESVYTSTYKKGAVNMCVNFCALLYVAPWTSALLATSFAGSKPNNLSKQTRNLKQ